jgi:hypothetical protein
MARGWESKSVEDQLDAADAARQDRAERHLSAQQRERQAKKESILLSRAQTLARLKAATNARYRAQLELALKHLDQQLKDLE